MIKFEIYSSTKNIPPSPVSIYYSTFLIGNTSRCHLKLRSNNKSFPCLKCDVLKEKITLETINNIPFFINGKKVLGLASIQINDLITLEKIVFKVIDIQPETIINELNHEVLYDKFYEEKEEYEPILTAIEKELIYSSDELISGVKGRTDEL